MEQNRRFSSSSPQRQEQNRAKGPVAASTVLLAEDAFDGQRFRSEPIALGLRGERITWLAPLAALGTGAYPVEADASMQRFPDACLLPGFHDAHLHFFHAALYASPLATTFVGTSEADCVSRLQRFASRRPRGEWLLAQGWREYLWDPPRLPSRTSLDVAFPDQPIALYSGDAHTLWLNSCALDILGITRESQSPQGGSYDKDGEGELTGLVREAAAMELMPQIVAAFSSVELLEAYRSFQEHLNSLGITSVCDMALTATSGLDFIRADLFSALEHAGQLTLRPHLFPTLTEEALRSGKLEEMQRELQGPLVRACGYKQFFDGVSSQHTAWLAEPYTNARFPGDCGRPTIPPQELDRLLEGAQAKGQLVRIHTIGDEAIHQALDSYERSQRTGRLVLEHLEGFLPEDIPRLAKLGVIASVQPRHITLDPGGPERDMGPHRVPFMWPFRQLLEAGATLAFGTDAPVTDPDPLRGLYTAITRQDAVTHQPSGGWLPQERLTGEEALEAYTRGAAFACGREGELGCLAAGALADIQVVERGEGGTLSRPQALFVGGRVVFE